MSQEKRPAEKTGKVTSNKMRKTVVVAVDHTFRHGQFGKYVRRTRKFYAHDEANACQVGDTVIISETRPMSKLKRWKIVKVVRHGLRHSAENEAL